MLRATTTVHKADSSLADVTAIPRLLLNRLLGAVLNNTKAFDS